MKFTGEFKMIKKSLLRIDSTYQTDVRKKAAIKKIAENFCWQSFGTLAVSRRGGIYYVIDGQRRTCVAKLIDEIVEVPCIVFKSMDVVNEARSFVNINVGRAPVSTLDKFNARVVAGDETAIALKSLVESCGWEIRDYAAPMSFKCIAQVEKFYKSYGASVVENTLNFIAEHHEGCLGKVMFTALVSFEQALHKQRNESLYTYAHKLRNKDLCLDAVTRAAAYHKSTSGNSSQWIYIDALLGLVNKYFFFECIHQKSSFKLFEPW